MPATGLQRLWAEVRPHAIEAGAVGEFVALQLRAGPAEAAQVFPEVAGHGVDECPTCSEVARDVRALLGVGVPLYQLPETERPPRTSVTMLLTDIEGAIALWERDAAAMSVFLGQHDQ